ncbi:MAG: hypothetical protein Q9195_004223 [Heterodermia aff. obscurata]
MNDTPQSNTSHVSQNIVCGEEGSSTPSAGPTIQSTIFNLRKNTSHCRQLLRDKRQKIREERSAIYNLEDRFCKLIPSSFTQIAALDIESADDVHSELVRKREDLAKLISDYDLAEQEYDKVELQLEQEETKWEELTAKAVPRLSNREP